MEIKKRNPELQTVREVIENNVGMPIEEFLNPPAVCNIDNVDNAVAIIKEFGNSNKNITIVGDYDADGICASAILSLAFNQFHWKHKIRLPKRFSEGYGLSEEIIDEIDDGLLITVDNGIAASDAIKKAKDKGITVIVTDHHLPDAESNIPDADIVIDPKAIEHSADFSDYCGAGLAYKIALKLLGENNVLIPKLVSLASIATVADVMPLIGENRSIVKRGLLSMLNKGGRTLGLGAILDRFSINSYISAKDIAYKIGPAINAPGRLKDNGAQLSLQALMCDGNPVEATEIADLIFQMNTERKEIKTSTIGILEQNIKSNNLSSDRPMIVYEAGLPEGLVGIFAGSLAEKYRTPCIVLTDTEEDGVIRGSGRSYGGINLKTLLDKNQELFIKYGGHADAVGISAMNIENLDTLRENLKKELSEENLETDDNIYYDLEIDATQLNDMFGELAKYEPFGQGNPEIVFLIRNFFVSNCKYLQNGRSVKLAGKDASALCFDLGDEYKEMGEPKIVDFIGVLTKNSFNRFVTKQIEVFKILKQKRKETIAPLAQQLRDLAKQLSK